MCRRASAGRRRAARIPPTAPAIRPPSTPSPIARTTSPASTGAPSRRQPSRGVPSPKPCGRRGPARQPAGPPPAPPPRRRRQRDPEGADQRRAADPDQRPERRPRSPLRDRLAAHLAHDPPLAPADRLQRPELAGALVDRRQGEQAGDQERRDERDDRERGPSLSERFLASTSEPDDAIGEVLRRGHLRAGELALDRLAAPPPPRRCRRRGRDGVDAALAVRELAAGQRHVDVGGVAAERRLAEPDDLVLCSPTSTRSPTVDPVPSSHRSG